MLAAMYDRRDMVAFLLEQGADANARDREGYKALELSRSDDTMMTLLYAAEEKSIGNTWLK
jgi:ankyrin repeat protein